MTPTTSRDFQKAAAQRLTAAETLFRAKLNLDAQYIGGYAVECSLKALILERTPEDDREAKLIEITKGAKWHRSEELVKVLRGLGVPLPLHILRRTRRRHFIIWSPDLRYETGRRDTGETNAFLTTAKVIYDWVEGQLS